MKKTLVPLVSLLFFIINVNAQNNETSNSLIEKYYADQEKINNSFSAYYYGNFDHIYSLNATKFIRVMDSLQDNFDSLLISYQKTYPDFDSAFIEKEKKGIKYSFDNFIVKYPYYHSRLTSQKISPNNTIDKRLDDDSKDINNPDLLNIDSFVEYLKSFLYVKSKIELENPVYKSVDNQQLRATLKLIPEYFNNPNTIAYLRHYYLYDYIDRFGIKNIEDIYTGFLETCKDTSYINSVKSYYEKEKKGREGHLIQTYKTVDDFKLDIHLFLPENTDTTQRYPVMVYFHGGSWSEGKPDWFFPAGEWYAQNGWVAAAIEYRIADREGTLPFESVMDAKSAIRWLRQHAEEYNIDMSRIVETGNSAGGHLVLATALVENWNEKTDDLNYSCVPDVLLVNSGVFDLTDTTSWICQGLRDRNMDVNLVKEISPNYLIKKGLPPTLIIHGTNDRNVPFSTAKEFVDKMEHEGNDVEFHALEGAGHYIWYGKYGKQVSDIRKNFLEKLGY